MSAQPIGLSAGEAATNLKLPPVVVASVPAQLAMHHITAMQQRFPIRPLSVAGCALTLAPGRVPLVHWRQSRR
jgi:hypothetical protein